MPITIEPIGPSISIGESPFWDEESQNLYYIGGGSKLFSYNSKTGAHHEVKVETGGEEKRVSFALKVKGEKEKFVIGLKNSFAIVTWDGESSEPLIPQHLVDVEDQEKCHLNDGKCDPSHRLWAGSMGYFPKEVTSLDEMVKEQGSLYSMSKDRTVVKHLSKVTLSNGLAWSLDKKYFYFVDSLKYKVFGYDYDDNTGTIGNLMQMKESPSLSRRWTWEDPTA
uniref:SMP-30/Gluconolactonase/LRE-like region domain-containing protein n=1 Tax=Graphocephala atropunctata TaxID=36148 RepID=A0A1B6KSB2_9HEMI